ncbi:MAG: undecaprenyldiphospho-muramoylpentapeptide beta-N-acetylglucosaminyltransferase [Holosporales bacterium]|jgi:UDP-N-acetylglucosamine--N-acetylmuramyl-(pentapeptide) pyrophosphoryl-undecaprenol N-acetylglucosamine transferase|nr:undecaprenyldiphospho-muramoylpentapeptide beta-N-acetylglucosaminyltransferase [Holosporales bacterium]
MGKTIIIAAGGTGGHVFPALCLAREFKKSGYDVIFSTDARGFAYLAEFQNDAIVQDIKTSSRLKLYVSLIFNVLKSMPRLLKLKPSIVVGFGGYPSAPFIFASQILGIKTVIHEQNAVIGKANKLLSKMASQVLTSFKNTKGISKGAKVFCVGNPTRYEAEYPNAEQPSNKLFTILIFGGSQGAKIFSDEIVKAICNIPKFTNIKVFHQGRLEDLSIIKNNYEKAGIKHFVNSFFDNINELYKQADLVISRAGASSVFEIIGFKKPSILIPFKGSINGDQAANAEFLRSHSSAIVINEDVNLRQKLETTIANLINNRNKLLAMSEQLSRLQIPNVTKNMTRLIENKMN